MPLPPPVEPEIREADAVWQLGSPLSAIGISVPGGEGPAKLRGGPDRRIWFTLNKGVAAVTMAGAVTHYPPPAGDRFDSFGFVGGTLLLCFLRNARKVEFRNLAGQPDGRSFSLRAQMKFPRFDPGPDGTEWISSIRAAEVIWVRPDGGRGSTEEQSSPGYALTSDGLMWGLSGGLFALDAAGVPRHWIHVPNPGSSIAGNLLATDDGGLWFSDGPGPGDEGSTHWINRYDRPANLLQRWRLPEGWVPHALCPAPDGSLAVAARDGSSACVGTFSRSGAAMIRKVQGAQLLASVAPGADGRFWYADSEGSRLYSFAL